MRYIVTVVFLAGVALAGGCSSKDGTKEGKSADPKGGAPAGGRMTVENTNRIVREQLEYNGVKQMFAGNGEPTNEDKPGLMPGNKFVGKEDGKKVYVSFGLNGKANGVAWEGFGGR